MVPWWRRCTEPCNIKVSYTLIYQKSMSYNRFLNEGSTHLHGAVAYGDVSLVSWLLKNKKEEVDAVDSEMCTALHVATQEPKVHLRIVRELLKYKADILARDLDGNTPLHFAAYDPPEVLKTLITYGCGENPINDCSMYLHARNKWGETPLYNAVQNRNVPVVRLLLQCRVDATSADNFGITSPHKAASFNDYDEEDRVNSRTNRAIVLAQLLLSHFADVMAQDIRGHSALVCAVDNGSVGMVKLLLKNGADVNQVDVDGRTPMDIAIFRRDIHIKMGDGNKRVQHQIVVRLLTTACAAVGGLSE